MRRGETRKEKGRLANQPAKKPGVKPAIKPVAGQYSSGSRMVVTERSRSVMIQSFVPPGVA
jgi:hypothetical protein